MRPERATESAVRLDGLSVCMFVYNSVTNDSRVLKEAGTLRDAGASVTIVGLGLDELPADETRDGIRILRVGRVPKHRKPVRRAGLVYAAPDASRRARWIARIKRWRQRGPRELADMAWVKVAGPLEQEIAKRSYWGRVWWRIFVWSRASLGVAPRADVYHGHDLEGVLVAWRHARRRRRARVVYDSHELYLQSGAKAAITGRTRKYLTAMERFLSRRANAVITVNVSIADELVRRYGIRRPMVVMNSAPLWMPEVELPRFDRFREVLPIATDRRIVLYQGGFVRDRGLERIVAALDDTRLSNAVAVFLGYGHLKPWLEEQSAAPQRVGRLFVLDAVPPNELLEWTASADVCVMPTERTNLNNWYSTPNKLFEALAAGIPVVASEFPEIARIVREAGAGELCDPTDIDSIAAALARILALPPSELEALRRRCRTAARERYNWGYEAVRLLEVYTGLVPRRRTRRQEATDALAATPSAD